MNPAFQTLSPDTDYVLLYNMLWQADQAPSSTAEKESLRQYIETCAEGLGLWSETQEDTPSTDEDEGDESEQPPPAPEIRYIDLDKHPTFRIHHLRDSDASFIVRQEYVDFMDSAMSQRGIRKRFFLTGKSMGACYFLFLLLAACKPVFFIPDTDWVYYFSANGVQKAASSAYMGTPAIQRAISRSWVLIDVDLGPSNSWLPQKWIVPCDSLVYTSSPHPARMNHFTKQFKASPWYMRPWSAQEIAAVTKLDNKDAEDVRRRFKRSGPIARSLFSDPDLTDLSSIDEVIRTALANDVLSFASSMVEQPDNTSHRMFLIKPLEGIDEGGMLII
ncbi:hypothetical protein B0H17DRAFT_1213259 [Mycena rosella]|uniref:Uncharacterized protein n=1 Tax=Mycena rosella TaxID=1033263 RepID=A0AAD7CR73_MYCRO|nr:hypothetical protein B0H17DRAFT_1213259 [Mycena rosella]